MDTTTTTLLAQDDCLLARDTTGTLVGRFHVPTGIGTVWPMGPSIAPYRTGMTGSPAALGAWLEAVRETLRED